MLFPHPQHSSKSVLTHYPDFTLNLFPLVDGLISGEQCHLQYSVIALWGDLLYIATCSLVICVMVTQVGWEGGVSSLRLCTTPAFDAMIPLSIYKNNSPQTRYTPPTPPTQNNNVSPNIYHETHSDKSDNLLNDF